MSDSEDDPPDPSGALLERWQKHADLDALNELLKLEVSILRDRLRGRARGALPPSCSRSDIAQEAVLGMLKVDDAPQFESPIAMRAYLWRSALRLLAAHGARAQGRPLALDATQSQAFATALARSGGQSALDRHEIDAALELTMSLLEPADREALELHYAGGMSMEAIASELGIQVEAAKKRVARARRRLAERLGDWSELIG